MQHHPQPAFEAHEEQVDKPAQIVKISQSGVNGGHTAELPGQNLSKSQLTFRLGHISVACLNRQSLAQQVPFEGSQSSNGSRIPFPQSEGQLTLLMVIEEFRGTETLTAVPLSKETKYHLLIELFDGRVKDIVNSNGRKRSTMLIG